MWNAELGKAFELSSMGIRVDESALRLQVGLTGDEDRLKMDWHQDLLNANYLSPSVVVSVNLAWQCCCFTKTHW